MLNSIASCFQDIEPKHTGVMTFTFLGHMTLSVT